jgi:hypothetical protein
MSSNSIQPGVYGVNGVYVRVDAGPDGKAVLSRYDSAAGGMRVLEGDERARWLKALDVNETTTANGS